MACNLCQPDNLFAEENKGPRSRRAVLVLAVCLAMVMAGCSTPPRGCPDLVIGPVYQPVNVYGALVPFPEELRRVALLPLSCELPGCGSVQEALEMSLHLELGKRGKFELVRIRPDQIREMTGHWAWQPKERLPAALIEGLIKLFDCDGVLLPELSHLNSYPPLVIGWHVRLMDLKSLEILWAVDEVFQASEPAVANAARKHHLRHSRHCRSLADSKFILVSPLLFGRYTTEAIVSTIPKQRED
jgi:hypothetical protein